MANDKLLTIAIPTYNRSKLLARTLESVLPQADGSVEVLVSDNASTDDTDKIMADICRRYEVTYIRNQNNIGPDANFLQCMRLSKGKYFLLLGSDDIMTENALGKILNFLSNNSGCDLVFMNHTFFENEYKGISHCKQPLFEDTGDVVTTDKKVLMDYANTRLTFMSSLILSKAAFSRVTNPEKYIGTYFIHTCVVMEAISPQNSGIGIMTSVCIAQDITFGNAGLDNDMARIFPVFGKGMEYTYCVLAPKMNFDEAQMKAIYTKWISFSWPRAIMRLKISNSNDWKQSYAQYGKPVLKKYKKAALKIKPYLLMPGWFARFLYKAIRPIYKKFKNKVIF